MAAYANTLHLSPNMSGSTDWQLDRTLAESNLHMLQNTLCCDVTFEVGPEGGDTEIIEAHKY